MVSSPYLPCNAHSRLYDIYPIVEMSYERRGDGYAGLGSYFDGQNTGQVKFAYTQPVFMRYSPVRVPYICFKRYTLCD